MHVHEVAADFANPDGQGRDVDYAYDKLNRLTSETVRVFVFGQGWRTTEYRYEYDNVGNRQSKATLVDHALTELIEYDYDENDWLLTETRGSDVTSYEYDANGSQVRKRVNAVDQVINQWDQQGRLVGVDTDADGDWDVRYQHDDGGLRVSRTENSVETKRLWDHSLPYGQVVAEYVAGDPAATVRYTFGLQVISQERVPYANSAPTTYLYYQDGHSGVRQMAQAHPNALLLYDGYTYDAFGVTLASIGSTPNTRLYRGEVRDPLTGLIDLRARPTYDPSTGRFGSADPFDGILTNPITRHRFLYAGADPVDNTDPTGRETLSGQLSVGGVGSSIAGQSTAGTFQALTHTSRLIYTQVSVWVGGVVGLFTAAWDKVQAVVQRFASTGITPQVAVRACQFNQPAANFVIRDTATKSAPGADLWARLINNVGVFRELTVRIGQQAARVPQDVTNGLKSILANHHLLKTIPPDELNVLEVRRELFIQWSQGGAASTPQIIQQQLTELVSKPPFSDWANHTIVVLNELGEVMASTGTLF